MATHLVVGAGLLFFLLDRAVSRYGLESHEGSGAGLLPALDFLLWSMLVMMPLAAFEGWTIASCRYRWAGVLAASLATAVHSWIGSWPATFRLSGDAGPVSRDELSTSVAACAVLLLVHLVAVLVVAGLCVLQRGR